jgi:hypothetical protein
MGIGMSGDLIANRFIDRSRVRCLPIPTESRRKISGFLDVKELFANPNKFFRSQQVTLRTLIRRVAG